jgi:hypothetical protein
MAIELLDPEKLFSTDDNDELGGDDSFPDAVIMIELGSGRYAAVNATTKGPDPMTVGLLATFPTEEEADIWEKKYLLSGNRVNKSFQEAREIAIGKPAIHGLALQTAAHTVAIHWVR